MAYNGGDRLSRTYIADVALDAYAAVSFSASGRCTIAASGGNTFVGIVGEKVASGQHAPVVWFGEVKARAGAAISAGAAVGVSGASGFLAAVASGAAADKFVIGRASTAAASGALFTLALQQPMHLNSGAAV